MNETLIDKTLLSYYNALMFFTRDRNPRAYHELTINISNILRIKQEKHHDGSGTLAKYYADEAEKYKDYAPETQFARFVRKETAWLTPLSFDEI